MNVERREVPTPQHEYVITLTSHEAHGLHLWLSNGKRDFMIAQDLFAALGAACPDTLRRFW